MTSSSQAGSSIGHTLPRSGWHLREAWSALRRLFKDPDDTQIVFEIIEALPGGSFERNYGRFLDTEVGKRIIGERIDLLDTLCDRARLLALPEGTLGRTYAQFMTEEQITADGLVEASEEGRTAPNEDLNRARFGGRIRDMHDLWHVTTGFGRDLIGEAGLLAFTFVQIRTPGIGLIVLFAYLESGPETRRMIRNGLRRGWRAQWLPAADWEHLLTLPLDQVRRELGIHELPEYTPEFSAAAPAASAAG